MQIFYELHLLRLPAISNGFNISYFSYFYEMYCIDLVLVPMKEHVLLLIIIIIGNNLLFPVPTYIVMIYYRKIKILTFLEVIKNHIVDGIFFNLVSNQLICILYTIYLYCSY